MTKDKYVLGKRSGSKQIVYHSYDYDGHTIVYRASVPYKEGAPKSYYIGLVDKQMAKLKASGKLKKYSESYIRKMVWLTRRKKVAIGVGAGALVVIGLTVGIVVTYFSHYRNENVIFDSETLLIDKKSVTLHRDINLNFAVNDFYTEYGYTVPDTLNLVAVNGVNLTPEQYEYSNGHLKINAEFAKGTVYVAAEAKHANFETDSWENIIKFANKGLDDLFIRYGRESVVGLEHDLEYDGKTIKARVIGEGHDRLVDEDGEPTNKAATLTFQIVLDPTYTVAYDSDADATAYSESDLYDTCEGILEKLPTIKDEIREVSKCAPTTDGAREDVSLKVFPLSLREINGADAYADARNYNNYYRIEESPYEYYLEKDSVKLNNIRKTGKEYWLRSPYLAGAQAQANIVTASGTTKREFPTFTFARQSSEQSLVVAFAIGETESFITDTWENVAKYANNGLETLKAHYGKKSFVGLEREIEREYELSGYKVRVIGENHDALADSDGHVAALTFEACYTYHSSVISNNPDYAVSYSNSILRNNLANFYELDIPREIKKAIPLVKKTNAAIQTQQEELIIPTVEQTEDHVFILSLRELGDVWFSLAEPYSLEERAYDYYRAPVNSIADINKVNHLRIKGACTDEDAHPYYWTRSSNPLAKNYTTVVRVKDGALMEINQGEYILYKDLSTTNLGYAFAFGFGVSNKPVTFETDSWDNVCYYALQGLDVLKEHYDLRSFIGATKEITLGEDTGHPLTHKVRVIGENQDTDVNGNKAPLTFEFTSNIAEQLTTGEWGTRYLNDAATPTWSTSDLRAYCNDKALPLLPFSLQNSIRTVTKKTVVYRSEEDKGVEETTEKLFPLSRNEIDNYYNEETQPKEDIALLKQENETYQYYIDTPDFLRTKLNGPTNSYWLRSPALQQSPSVEYQVAYSIDQNGAVGNASGKVTTWLGLAPAFAI